MMATRKLFIAFGWLLGAGWLATVGLLMSKALADDVPPPPPVDSNMAAAATDPNVEVMTRGPVHEAYAVPVSAGQTAGMIVPRPAPAPVEEVPPDMKPEDDKAVWIPGYWSWDEERKDFLWVSGVWRVPPPGYRWMPGYWQEAPGQGQQWVSGYWMPAHVEEATFMPQPPQSIETGPTSQAPDANHFWVSGHWQWHEGRYVWQPGYWGACQADWIWVPATYYWCPRGWVYAPGYWDYPLARRGLVFSPVYFAGPVAVYRPVVCLDVGVLSFSLFCHPSYHHYYFGDYYDDRYVALGIRPWFYYDSWRHGYDPLFGYYRWYHHEYLGEREWAAHLQGWHEYYRVHPDMRPPHTLAAQHALMASAAGRTRADFHQLQMAHDIHQMGGRPDGLRLQPVSAAEHAQLRQGARETVHFTQERQQFERSSVAGAAGLHGPMQPEKASMTNMPSFKSEKLPGAAAANANRLASRPAVGSKATGAAKAGKPPAPSGHSDNKRSRDHDKDKNHNN